MSKLHRSHSKASRNEPRQERTETNVGLHVDSPSGRWGRYCLALESHDDAHESIRTHPALSKKERGGGGGVKAWGSACWTARVASVWGDPASRPRRRANDSVLHPRIPLRDRGRWGPCLLQIFPDHSAASLDQYAGLQLRQAVWSTGDGTRKRCYGHCWSSSLS